MSNFIATAATTAASWVAAAANSAGLPSVVVTALKAATYATVTVGSYAAMAALTRPSVPKPSAGKVSIQQTMPPRIRVVNRARVAGATMLKVGKRNLYIVRALCVGPAKSIDAVWFHSDRIEINPSTSKVTGTASGLPRRYRGNGIWVLTRLGAVPETSFNDGLDRNGESFDDLGADVWTEDHRLDGQVSLCVVAAPVEREDYPKYMPFGHVDPSALPVLKVYDWRQDSTNGGSGAQRLNDPDTWDESWNPVVWLAQKRCGPPESAGFAACFNKRIQPQLASWTQAADDCDEAVALDAGGTEARYRTAGGWHTDENDMVDVCAQLLAAFDGYLVELGNGSLHVQAGVWRAPTFTIPAAHVLRLVRRTGARTEAHKNHYDITYTDPERDWAVVPGDPWQDAADIAVHGKRPERFAADWTPSHAQARRLAKIAMARGRPPRRGTVRTTLYGLMLFWGQPPEGGVANRRWFNLERRRADGTIETMVCEVASSPKFHLLSLSVEFDYIVASPEAYDWDETTEEGAPPAPGPTLPVVETSPAPFAEDLVAMATFDHLVRYEP